MPFIISTFRLIEGKTAVIDVEDETIRITETHFDTIPSACGHFPSLHSWNNLLSEISIREFVS